MSGWVRHVAREIRGARTGGRRTALPYCPCHPAGWIRHEGEAPWCPRCARPVCGTCRAFYRLAGMRVDAGGDGVGIYDQRCGCT